MSETNTAPKLNKIEYKPFKERHTVEELTKKATELRQKYPAQVPIIVEKTEKSKLPALEKEKFLVPLDITVGQFIHIIRKRLKLNSTTALFIFVKSKGRWNMIPVSALISQVYKEHADPTGFIFVNYSGENTFG